MFNEYRNKIGEMWPNTDSSSLLRCILLDFSQPEGKLASACAPDGFNLIVEIKIPGSLFRFYLVFRLYKTTFEQCP